MRPHVFPRVAGFLAMSMGSVVLAGWLLHLPGLQRLHARLAIMPPYTAFCLILSGIALTIIRKPRGLDFKIPLARLCAMVVAFLGFLSLAGQWLAQKLAAATQPGGVVPMLAAFELTCIGLALSLFDVEIRQKRPSKFLSWTVIVTILTIVFLFVADPQPLALHTQLTFLLLSLAMLAL